MTIHSGNSRPMFVQDKLHYMLMYFDVLGSGVWALIDIRNLGDFSSLSQASLNSLQFVFYSTGGAVSAPLPELTRYSWQSNQINLKDIDLASPVKCAATISDCTRCDVSNTDACLAQPNSNLTQYYCVCKQGYSGETCDKKTMTCPGVPEDFLGRVHDYFEGGPFYPGEMITVSCNSDYPELISETKYISTCQTDGNWSSSRSCLDLSILPSNLDPQSLTEKEIISLVLKEVKHNIAKRDTDDSDSTSFFDDDDKYKLTLPEIIIVVASWNLLPWIILLIHYGCARKCCSKESQETVSFVRLFSYHSYVWIYLYLIYIVVSHLMKLSNSENVFYYLDVFSITWTVVIYLIHIVTMFLCDEWRTINRKHPKIEREWISRLRSGTPDIYICVECYHTQTIQKPVTRYIRGELSSYLDPIDEPVVTEHYRRAFKYDNCTDTSPEFKMKPNCITELRLKLRVACADHDTKSQFEGIKERMCENYKDVDEKLNMFQKVLLTTERIVLHDTREFVIQGISDSVLFYMKPWFYVILTLLLMGVPHRACIVSRFIVSQEYTVIKRLSCQPEASTSQPA